MIDFQVICIVVQIAGLMSYVWKSDRINRFAILMSICVAGQCFGIVISAIENGQLRF